MDKVKLTLDVESDPMRMRALVMDKQFVIENEMKKLADMVARGYMDEEIRKRVKVEFDRQMDETVRTAARIASMKAMEVIEARVSYLLDNMKATVLKMGETSE